MGLHGSGVSSQPIRCPSVIWTYQDLFLMSVVSSLTQRRLGGIVLNAVDGSGVGGRRRRVKSGPLWIVIGA